MLDSLSIGIWETKKIQIMTNSLLVIEETNLSNAWRKALEHIINNSGYEITPLLLSLTEFEE